MCSSLPRRITLWRSAEAAPKGSFDATSTSAGSRSRSRSRIAPPTTYAGSGTLRRSGKSRCRRSSNDIAQNADPFDLHFDGVAGVQRSDACRRAGEDHIAGKERHHLRDELDDRVAFEAHLLGVAVLLDRAVHARLNAQARGIEIALDVRAEGTEGVEGLGAGELHVFLLQVAGGDVVRAHESLHEVTPSRRRDVLRFAADDDGQLTFVIDALRYCWTDDRAARREDGRRRLHEDDRL